MSAETDPVLIATELRVALGRLVRRLRAEHVFSLPQSVVLGRLDRDGSLSISELAAAEHVRPQSMAQTVNELQSDGLVAKRPDPGDARRALVELTERGSEVLSAERQRREGWLATAIAHDLDADEQAVLTEAVELLKRLAGR
jgi:DNA-binding MarR family transcriptional regulator